MAYTSLLIIDAQSSLYTVRVALQQRYDVTVSYVKNTKSGLELIRKTPPEHLLVNPNGLEAEMSAFFAQLARLGKNVPVIVAGDHEMESHLRSVYPHVRGRVPAVYDERDLMPLLQQPRPTHTGKLRGMALAERAALVQANQLLERRVREVMTLQQIGKSVASLTDLDVILARIVEAAVYLLRAEEGSIMLADLNTNELYLRAQKGLGEKQAKGFNLKIQDTLIGSVVRTRRPVKMARGASNDPRLKVVTGYLVNALLYVPLILRGQVIGVLGVSNQTAPKAFTEHDQRLMEALADYAAMAIQLARQYKTLARLRQDLAVSHTIAATVAELHEQLSTDDPNVLSALRRIEGAASILIRLAEAETTVDV
jgi:two-component system NtrC family sensor kinase